VEGVELRARAGILRVGLGGCRVVTYPDMLWVSDHGFGVAGGLRSRSGLS
jgi:hypothetical protein